MAHPIFVCIPCKLTMHTSRNAGIHCKNHHKEYGWYGEAEEKGIIVDIGECENTLWNPCNTPHDRPATEDELKRAQDILKHKVADAT